jgi:hypothetical protein
MVIVHPPSSATEWNVSAIFHEYSMVESIEAGTKIPPCS